jgi:hypothetical protein
LSVVKQPFPSNNSGAVEPNGTLGQIWYYLLQSLWRRSGGAGPSLTPVIATLTGSPFIYDTDINGTLIVSGGTVSAISVVRSSQNFPTGQTAGAFPMVRGDSIAITYSGAPDVSFLPSELAGSETT